MKVQSKPDSKILILILLFWFVATAVAHMLLPLFIGGQTAVYLEGGRALLAGEQPYIGYASAEWPLTLYIGMLPALLEQIFQAHIIPIAKWLILALTIASALTTRHLLNRYHKSNQMVAFWAAIMIAAYSFYLIFNDCYGQIEHLFILTYFPWFLLRWSQWEGVPVKGAWRFGIAILAAIGVSLNPVFIIIALSPEIYWYITRRNLCNFRAADSIVFSLVVAGSFLLLVLPGDVRDTFWGYILPFILGRNVASDMTAIQLSEQHRDFLQSILIGAVMLFYRPKDKSGLVSLWQPMGLLLLVATFFQIVPVHWENSYVHIHLIICLYLVMLFFDHIEVDVFPLRWYMSLKSVISANGLLLFGVIVYVFFVFWKQDSEIPDDLQSYILQYTDETDQILIIDTAIDPGYPLYTQLDRQPGSRYSWAFPLSIYDEMKPDNSIPIVYSSPDNLPETEERYLQELSQDLLEKQPLLVFVRDTPRCAECSDGFVTSGYFDHTQFFDQLPIDYQYAGFIDQYRVYQLQTSLPYEGDVFHFGDYYTLRAFQVSGTEINACDTLTLTSWWRFDTSPEMDVYSMSFTVTDADGNAIVQNDGALLGRIPGADFMDQRMITIPCGLEAGSYNILLSIYNTLLGNQAVIVTDNKQQPIAEYLYLTTVTIHE